MNIAEMMEEFCEDYGYEFRGDYSGRCMYGRTCCGMIGADIIKMTVQFLGYVGAQLDFELDGQCSDAFQDMISVLETAQYDSMGLGMIVYFPRVQMED